MTQRGAPAAAEAPLTASMRRVQGQLINALPTELGGLKDGSSGRESVIGLGLHERPQRVVLGLNPRIFNWRWPVCYRFYSL